MSYISAIKGTQSGVRVGGPNQLQPSAFDTDNGPWSALINTEGSSSMCMHH